MIPVQFIALLLLAGNAVSLDFSPCAEGGVPPNSLFLNRCFEQPCEFTFGSNVTGSVNMTVGETSTDLVAEMTVDHSGSQIKFPIPGFHICIEREGCQFESGESAKYYFDFPVNVDLPNEDIVTFRMVVKNQNGSTLSCAEFKGKVVGKAKNEE